MKNLRIALGVAAVALSTVTLTPAVGSAASPSIVGGGQAKDAPWLAHYAGGVLCTSSVIADRWILTAKHCINGSNGRQITFHVGMDSQGGQVVHSDKTYTYDNGDLALVRVDGDISSAKIRLVDRPSAQRGDTVRIYGWGRTDKDVNEHPRYAKVGTMTVSNPNGKDTFGGPAVSADRKDGVAAKGDSGGPMMNSSGQQIGVSSNGNDTDHSNYADVGAGRQWIRQVAGV